MAKVVIYRGDIDLSLKTDDQTTYCYQIGVGKIIGDRLININNSDNFNNSIVRCYPVENGMYDPRDIRFDKKRPNNYKIVVENIKFYNNNWNNSNIEDIYYKKNKNSRDWSRIIKNQNENLQKMIKLLSPLGNSRWLDLGCGYGKMFNIIKTLNL